MLFHQSIRSDVRGGLSGGMRAFEEKPYSSCAELNNPQPNQFVALC